MSHCGVKGKYAFQWEIFKAFTLIELLVVVAIIAVLISMLLPALGSAREQAKLAVCTSNLRQIGLGLQMYNDEYKKLPANGGGSPYALWVTGAGGVKVPYRLMLLYNAKYIKDPHVFYCPQLAAQYFENFSYETQWQTPISRGDMPDRGNYNMRYFWPDCPLDRMKTCWSDLSQGSVKIHNYEFKASSIAILSDLYGTWWGDLWNYYGHNGKGWNILYTDQSIRFMPIKYVESRAGKALSLTPHGMDYNFNFFDLADDFAYIFGE
jgi:prepilin-type N-terminal cleavage/methylation domain-containing protein